jgi:hypothetical protein
MYIQFKGPLLGAWMAQSHSDKATVEGQRYFPSIAPQTGSGTQSAFYSMGTEGVFLWNKNGQAANVSLTESRVRNTWSYTSTSPTPS